MVYYDICAIFGGRGFRGDWWGYCYNNMELGGREMMLLYLKNRLISQTVKLLLKRYALPAVFINLRRGFYRLLFPHHSCEWQRF